MDRAGLDHFPPKKSQSHQSTEYRQNESKLFDLTMAAFSLHEDVQFLRELMGDQSDLI